MALHSIQTTPIAHSQSQSLDFAAPNHDLADADNSREEGDAMKTSSEMRQALADKAAEDEEFRNRLLSDPRSVIEEEFDLQIPDGVEIQVHEDSTETAHVILPPSPKLSETQLAQVAGGGKGGSALYWCL